jgi:hypothetical protein
MKVELHQSPARALDALASAQGDLALVAPSSDWAARFSPDGAQVIVTLPMIAGGSQPQLLVFGHAPPQPSGDDETLILFFGEAPSLPGAIWQAHSGTTSLAGLPGYLDDSILALHPGARIAGRYPRPIKVTP